MSGVAKAKLKPAADVPTDFGRHLRACMRCKLLKTFEQVRCAQAVRLAARVQRTALDGVGVVAGAARLRRVRACARRNANPSARCSRRVCAAATRRRHVAAQFYEGGCENCPKLGLESDKQRIADCTTTNFNGCVRRTRVLRAASRVAAAPRCAAAPRPHAAAHAVCATHPRPPYAAPPQLRSAPALHARTRIVLKGISRSECPHAAAHLQDHLCVQPAQKLVRQVVAPGCVRRHRAPRLAGRFSAVR
jgi:hypothetical protein